ncbi:MAG: chemotaxis protein CheX [Bryobacteraceae bacterium]
MNVKDLIINCIQQSTLQVFSTMLGEELLPAGVTTERDTPDVRDGVVSFVGLAGSWAGTGSITCSPALACKICAQMLMTEAAAVNEEVLDAVAEITNMIIGNVKTDLEPHLGLLGLSVPTVVYGHNFKTRNAGHAEWVVTRFAWGEETLTVKLNLTPQDGAKSGVHGVSKLLNEPYSVDV